LGRTDRDNQQESRRVTLTHSADCHDPVCPQPHEERQAPGIDAELLGRAIREHRQAEFDPHAVISMTHLCFDDCAENIAARYDELASR
jgi:hypothetical protein